MKKLFLLLAIGYQLLAISQKTEAQYSLLYSFSPAGGNHSGDLTPYGGKFYGLGGDGGANGDGCVFSINMDGSGYKDLFDFNGTNGLYPFGSLTISGNKMYGMTSLGGPDEDGNIFSLDTDGSAFNVLLNFDSANGESPYGSLLLSGKTLFGVTPLGGPNDSGILFSIDTNGSGFRILYNNFNAANGEEPVEQYLAISGGVLYGTASYGGSTGNGTIFRIDTDGTGFSNLFDFNSTNGTNPFGSLTLNGNKLFGMATAGGSYGAGCIFSIDTGGSGFKDLFEFNNTNGRDPFSALSISGNRMYSMTQFGGADDSGCMFSIDTNGTGYIKLLDFNTTLGVIPWGDLTLMGNVLYGMTQQGGLDNSGNVFSYTICNGNTFDEPICIATIDTATNKAEVIWGRTNSPPSGGQGYYNIYKDTTSGFSLIHTQLLDSLSEYIDTTSFPSDGPESYEISTFDSCGESALSSPATTIYLTTTSGVNVYILNWTAYVGFTPTVYRIFRGPSMNALVQIDSVPATTLTYHDTLPPAGSIYLLEAVSPTGACIPTTHRPGHPSVTLSGSFSNGYNVGALVTGNKSINSFTNLKTFPNPSNGVITLSYSSSESENISQRDAFAQISVIDELGQMVYKENIPVGIGTIGTTGTVTLQLNLSNLASGIYTLRMESNTGITEKKLLIIQR